MSDPLPMHIVPDKADPDALIMYTVYDHPTDYPDWFVVRRWFINKGMPVPEVDHIFMHHKDLDVVRFRLANMGLICLTRDETDNPKIIETWI